MKKSKILVLLMIVALFLAIPAVTLAQAPPLARFAGTAMVDDAAAPRRHHGLRHDRRRRGGLGERVRRQLLAHRRSASRR